MDFSPEVMRQRFHALKADVEAQEARSAPLREEHARISREMHATLNAISAQFLEMELGLFEKKNELAFIARALGGKTGPAPE